MGRAPCCDKANVKRGPWSPEEDHKLKSYIETHGTGGNWIALPHKIGLKRCGKSCRLRWLNYLRPNIKHGGFTQDEDDLICTLYITIGSRWSIIAAQLPGRTDNDIKNYWNTRLKKKLLGKQRREMKKLVGGVHQTNYSINNSYNNNNNMSLYPQVMAGDYSSAQMPSATITTTTSSSSHADHHATFPYGEPNLINNIGAIYDTYFSTYLNTTSEYFNVQANSHFQLSSFNPIVSQDDINPFYQKLEGDDSLLSALEMVDTSTSSSLVSSQLITTSTLSCWGTDNNSNNNIASPGCLANNYYQVLQRRLPENNVCLEEPRLIG